MPLRHLTVAVAALQQVLDVLKNREAFSVNIIGDGTQGPQQVRERRADTAFVVSPAGVVTIYVDALLGALLGSGTRLGRFASARLLYFDGHGAQAPLLTLVAWVCLLPACSSRHSAAGELSCRL